MFTSYLPKLMFLWEEKNSVFILLYQVLLGRVGSGGRKALKRE